MSITRPLLAAKAKPLGKVTPEEFNNAQAQFMKDLQYPVLVTPKLDGIRCLKIDGQVVSRSFKPIPNEHVRRMLERLLPDGIDGELMVRGGGTFNEIQSAIMTIKGAPKFEYWAFDYVKDSIDKPYEERIKDLKDWFESEYPTKRVLPMDAMHDVKLILPTLIETPEQMMEYEEKVVSEGYEGAMARTPFGPYKCGRATLKEGTLTKVVRVFRDEAVAVVSEFEEKMHNDNEQEEDEFGLAKRSSKKEGLVGADTLGRITVEMPDGTKFGIGTGFDDKQRKEIWDNKDQYEGKIVTYEYRELTEYGVPRFPVFVGFRHPDDT